jgi:hypothetical protein
MSNKTKCDHCGEVANLEKTFFTPSTINGDVYWECRVCGKLNNMELDDFPEMTEEELYDEFDPHVSNAVEAIELLYSMIGEDEQARALAKKILLEVV